MTAKSISFPDCPPVAATAEAVRAGRQGAAGVMEACLARIRTNEEELKAWHYLDSERALRTAREADENSHRGPLAGVPIGLKDVIDTADMPTENGSGLDRGRRPRCDATVVARLRRAGALFPGKTVTTEYAYFHPGKTRNPHDLARTPGGSSSGSAAAVAAGMVPAAIGGQTVGSVIRPSSFNGTWGMKPSFGLIPVTGVSPLAHSLDHLGVFARNARDLALVIDAISGDDGKDDHANGFAPSQLAAALDEPASKPRLAFFRTFAWPKLDRSLVEPFEELAKALGAEEVEMPALFDQAFEVHRPILLAEMAANLGEVYRRGRKRLSDVLRQGLETGQGVKAQRYIAAQKSAARMRVAFAELMEGFDAAITPSVRGEAPVGLSSTGDPILCMLWTLLGAPAVNVPALKGEHGLPVGVQVVGNRRRDAETLRAAAWVGRELGALSRHSGKR